MAPQDCHSCVTKLVAFTSNGDEEEVQGCSLVTTVLEIILESLEKPVLYMDTYSSLVHSQNGWVVFCAQL